MSETDRAERDWRVEDDYRAEWPDPESAEETMLDAMSDVFYVVDRRGRIREWNDQFTEQLGYTDEEIPDLDPASLVAEADVDVVADALQRVVAGEEVAREVTLVTKDGERRPYEFTAAPLTDDADEVWGMVGTSRDISDRKERQRELERYEQLLETVGDGVYVLGPDRYVRRVNDALCEMLGYDRETLLGMHLSELVAGDATERAARLREQLRTGDADVATIEGEMVRADGSRFPAEGRFSLLSSASEPTTIGLVRDISDRQERAELLEGIHEATRELLTAATKQEVAETAVEVAYEYTDVATAGVRLLEDGELRMVAVETEDERLAEAPPPYEVGEGFVGEAYAEGEPVVYDEGVGDEDTPFDYSPVESAMLIPIPGHGMINLASLEPGAFDEATRELARLFAADVESALARADREEQLREREQELQEYETLVETVRDGVYMTNADTEFTMVNEALLDLLGYDDPDALLGEYIGSVSVSEAAVEDARERRLDLIESTDGVETIEGELERADGDTVPVETRFTLLPSGDGYTGSAGVVRDVSDRKEREELLKRLHEATRTLQTAESKRAVAEQTTVVAERLGFPTIAVRCLTDDGRLVVEAQTTSDERLAGTQMPDYEVGEGIVGQAYERGEPVVYDDLTTVEMKYDTHPVRSVLFVPIEGFGMLSIASTEVDAFDEIDRELGRILGADVRSAFERADREERLREREQALQRQQTYTTELLDAIDDVFYILDEDGSLQRWNESLPEVTGYTDAEIVEMRGRDFFPESEVPSVIEEMEKTLETGQSKIEAEYLTRDGERIPHEFSASTLEDPEGNQVIVGIARDITERKERERELQRQRDELETLNRINELVQGTIGALASAATREDIESTVCERLTSSPFYRFAWTGAPSTDGTEVTPQTCAGDGDGYLDAVTVPSSDSTRPGPGAEALSGGELVVVDDIESDPRFEPWREPALERGFRSVAVVPFRHGRTVHGILALYADRPAAFSDREIRAFEVLGDMVGFAISATQHRRLIEAETVLELEVDLPDSDTFFSELAARLDCTCQLLGSVPSGEAMVHYVCVSGASADAVDAFVTEAVSDRLESSRVVRSTEDGCILAVRLRNSTPELLQEAGARTVDIQVEPEVSRVVARTPRDTDIRTLLNAFGDVHGEPVLDAKREVERDSFTDEAFRTDVTDRLTDRQDAALSAAYFGGYFDWPRDSTAEEVAETLDISSATLHQHLRHAQRKLLAIYFDDRSGRTGPGG